MAAKRGSKLYFWGFEIILEPSWSSDPLRLPKIFLGGSQRVYWIDLGIIWLFLERQCGFKLAQVGLKLASS